MPTTEEKLRNAIRVQRLATRMLYNCCRELLEVLEYAGFRYDSLLAKPVHDHEKAAKAVYDWKKYMQDIEPVMTSPEFLEADHSFPVKP